MFKSEVITCIDKLVTGDFFGFLSSVIFSI